MEKVSLYRTSDDKVFTDKTEAISHETTIRMGNLLDKFVDATYQANMNKDTYKSILSANLVTLATLHETSRPKRKRRTNAQMAEDKDKAKAKAEAEDKVTQETPKKRGRPKKS